MNLREILVLWNRNYAYGNVEDLVKEISQLETPLSEPDEYEITKKMFCATWKWEKWIPSLNRPDKTIRIALEIELTVIKKGVLWSASDYAGYRDFVIPQTRAFEYLSHLYQNIDSEALIYARNEITKDLPDLPQTKSMWMRDEER